MTKINTSWAEFISFMTVWMIPSQTPIYIILRETMGYSILISYTVSALVSGALMFCIMTIIKNIK